MAITPGRPASGRGRGAAVDATEGDVDSACSRCSRRSRRSVDPPSSHAGRRVSTTTTTMHLAADTTPSTLPAAGPASRRPASAGEHRRQVRPTARGTREGWAVARRTTGGVGSRPQNRLAGVGSGRGRLDRARAGRGLRAATTPRAVDGPRYRRGVAKAPATEIAGGRAHRADLQPRPRLLPGHRRDQARPRRVLPRRRPGDRQRAARAAVHAAPLPDGRERREGPPEARARPARRRGWRPCGSTSPATACTPTSCA